MAKEGKKGVIAEFKEFIARGNVIDMAVGVVIGSAFTKIVNSLVNDVIMPVIGFIIGGINFSDFKIVLKEAIAETETTAAVAEVAINYGTFIQMIIDFLLIAIVVFTMVKVINRLRRIREKEEAVVEEPAPAPAEPEPSNEEKLLTEIRDLLKK